MVLMGYDGVPFSWRSIALSVDDHVNGEGPADAEERVASFPNALSPDKRSRNGRMAFQQRYLDNKFQHAFDGRSASCVVWPYSVIHIEQIMCFIIGRWQHMHSASVFVICSMLCTGF